MDEQEAYELAMHDNEMRPLATTRCKAITFAGQPGHLLVRCSLEEHETGSHIPSWEEGDRNE